MEKIKLSDAEWKIMQVLWTDAPQTYKQIEEALKEETSWSKHTILSFLKRMCEKGAIRAEQAKPAKHYYPVADKELLVSDETQSFAKKVFGGDWGLMLSSLTAQSVSETEIDEMLAMLQQAKEDNKQK